MDDLTIRAYDPADLEACRALWAELTEHHRAIYNDPAVGGESPGLYFDGHLAQVGPGRVWVAEQAGELVGLVSLIVEDQEAEVEPLVVAAAQRDRGIGRLLLNHVVVQARELGVRHLKVRPVARNLEALRFYHQAGFRTLGHIEMFIDLAPKAPDAWKPGPSLFDLDFKF